MPSGAARRAIWHLCFFGKYMDAQLCSRFPDASNCLPPYGCFRQKQTMQCPWKELWHDTYQVMLLATGRHLPRIHHNADTGTWTMRYSKLGQTLCCDPVHHPEKISLATRVGLASCSQNICNPKLAPCLPDHHTFNAPSNRALSYGANSLRHSVCTSINTSPNIVSLTIIPEIPISSPAFLRAYLTSKISDLGSAFTSPLSSFPNLTQPSFSSPRCHYRFPSKFESLLDHSPHIRFPAPSSTS